MIPPIKFFRLYIGIKAHFNTDSYNVIEKKCIIRGTSKEHFEKRRDCKSIIYFSSKFQNMRQASSFLIANIAYGNDYPFDDFEKAFSLYKLWMKNKERLTYLVEQDIMYILDYGERKNINIKSLFETENNQLPIVFRMYLANKIHIETLSLLNEHRDFTTQLLSHHKMWVKEILRIRKASVFVNGNKDRITSIIERSKL